MLAIVAIAAHRGDSPKEPGGAVVVPPGTEFPLADGGPATSTGMGHPSVAALTRVLRIDGQPDSVVSSVVSYMLGRQPQELHCLSQPNGAGCAPVGMIGQPDIGITSGVDNGQVTFDLWTWADVPAETAYVTYDDSDQHLWQRPIAGVVMFPNVAGADEVAVAHRRPT